jgi:hypothetical protein
MSYQLRDSYCRFAGTYPTFLPREEPGCGKFQSLREAKQALAKLPASREAQYMGIWDEDRKDWAIQPLPPS